MDLSQFGIELHNIWLAIVAIAFFDCLFIFAIGLAAAWSVSVVTTTLLERERVRGALEDDRYKTNLAELQLMAQLVKRIVEHYEPGDDQST